MGLNNSFPRSCFLCRLVEFHLVRILLPKMEHCSAWLAILLHLSRSLSFLPLSEKRKSTCSTLDLYYISNHPWMDYLLRNRFLLPNSIHFIRRTRHPLHAVGESQKNISKSDLLALDVYRFSNHVYSLLSVMFCKTEGRKWCCRGRVGHTQLFNT